jgi:hypothetical protein
VTLDKSTEEDNMAKDQVALELMVAELPDRELLSLINANVAAPINAALALNVLSDNSVAMAQATQTAPIVQGTSYYTLGQ